MKMEFDIASHGLTEPTAPFLLSVSAPSLFSSFAFSSSLFPSSSVPVILSEVEGLLAAATFVGAAAQAIEANERHSSL
jgi:hypothetical protein